ncbi:MAG TPA: COX aromatic rich motif-containing protein [Verrucomicrobiae bacterium]|nr:COX aromatic rich motif-containing protein [Verrucomicrobiae bacterium]
MTKQTDKSRQNRAILYVVLWVFVLVLLFAVLLNGTDIRMLNPKGFVAQEEFKLIVFTTAVLLAIAVPTLFFLYFFAWKYRESNTKAKFDPDKKHGKFFIFCLWAIPVVFMLVLAPVMWVATHKLEPQKSIDSENKTLTVQVIALRWKWLFIYPEQHIATVNYVQVPVDTPVEFDLTADDMPMSSFWVPHWGGQLYAMTGMTNKLNLVPTTLGDSTGSSAEINGKGFAGMKFTARASSKQDFDAWVRHVKQLPGVLDMVEYESLLKPSENNPSAFYSMTEADLYDKVLMKYMGSHDHHMGQE